MIGTGARAQELMQAILQRPKTCRGFLRSFRAGFQGGLRDKPQSSGCCFFLDLTPAIEPGDDPSELAGNSHSAAVQSHGIP
jgi:hypothetical protein